VGLGGETCNDCHTATNFGPGTNGTEIPDDSLLHNPAVQDQDLKVPQLRNLYTKTGFKDSTGHFNKRGFAYGHDGSVDNLDRFLSNPGFTLGPTQAHIDSNRADLVAYLLAFDTGMAPGVGRQVTFDGTNNNDPGDAATLDSLVLEADVGDIDLIAKGRVDGLARGFEYAGSGLWRSDRASELKRSTAEMRALGGIGGELTVMGVPPGTGTRMGIDRDRDGYADRDELDNGADPSDASSTPVLADAGGAGAGHLDFSIGPNPFHDATEIRFSLPRRGEVDATVFDIMGREVRRLAAGQLFEAGAQSLRWDGRVNGGRAAGPGVYFVRVKTDQRTWNRTIVRLR